MDSTTWAALIGSAVGGLTSVIPTLLGQHFSSRKELIVQHALNREHLYEEFIKEASARYIESLQGPLEDPTKLVSLFSLIGRIRLVSTSDVLKTAEEVGELILCSYEQPASEMKENIEKARHANPLLAFTEACRGERNTMVRTMSSLNYYTIERNSYWGPISPKPKPQSGAQKLADWRTKHYQARQI